MKKILFLSLVCIFLITGCSKSKEQSTKPSQPKPPVPQIESTNDFNIDIMKITKRNSNYLISPYSIEMALNMLKEGANNNTKTQIEKLTNRKLNDVSIKNRVKIANSLFINDEYKNKVKKSFSNKLVSDYNSEVLYDKFKNANAINNWVDKHTDGMIKKLTDNINPDVVIVIINAIAIDVEWSSPFECYRTTSEEFTKSDNTKMDVEMMHNNYESSNYSYLKNNEAKGIIIPYRTYNSKTGKAEYDGDKNLEFVGILPNDDVSTYIDNLTKEKLDSLFKSAKSASDKYEIRVSLPRYKYAYEVPNFKEILIEMGMKDTFNIETADFTKIMDRKDMKDNLYVSDAIHKTYIDLNEKGTKAAAVTGFLMKDTAAMMEDEKEVVSIKFNKPFIYMIRDSKTEEILFFGITYEPNKWNGSTCSED